MAELKTLTNGQSLANPLHIQRLETSLDMGPFMTYAHKVLSHPLTSTEDSDSEDESSELPGPGDKYIHGALTSKKGWFFLNDFVSSGTNFLIFQIVLTINTISTT